MTRINIVNADNKIDATPQRAYFKLKQTGGPKGEKGDTGAQGPQGATGPQGASASVVVNSTTTLPAGSDATVENIGTPQNVKLNFGIPTGPQGPQGEQGPQGAQGPQGLKGDTGAKGADGAAAKVTVGNTNTGAAGTNASVENTGSETYAVLNFTIPRGDKGETGPMPDIAQTTGQATDEVMSQKATTDALATKQNTLTAGTGITIASDTVSADTTVLATKEDLNDYAPQATTYTKTETDALLAPKLEADVVASLPATGEEGKLYLTPKAHTTETATGNPITATVTEDAGAIESFQLDGDTEQQTYTGKNLVGATEQDYENSGIKTTINADGTITCKGTCTQAYFQITRQTAGGGVVAATPCNIPAGTYTLSLTNTTSQFGVQLRLYASTASSDYVTATISKGGSSSTITLTSPVVMFYIWGSSTAVGQAVDETIGIQFEAGSAATTFEKFVGGTASPNPAYPQPIQTVTGEQTVTINGTDYPINLGKNLFNKDNAVILTGELNADKTYSTDTGKTIYIECKPNTTYSVQKADVGNRARLGTSTGYLPNGGIATNYTAMGTVVSGIRYGRITTGQNDRYLWFTFARGDETEEILTRVINSIQIEAGAQYSSYAPYITPIELCKLGTYQDYIYKDGDDWKVHKATAAYTLNGTESWSETSTGVPYTTAITNYALSGNTPVSEYFIGATNRAQAATLPDNNIGFNDTSSAIRLWVKYLDKWSTGASVATWLAQNPATIYYALKSASQTDTAITDSTLIAQLEAIRTAALETGTNTITNSASGSNLAGDMEITYYGYNPTNRYDKFIWLDLDNNYEQIGE